jgi:integrase/recombinase XerD
MKSVNFKSCLSSEITEFIRMKQVQGYSYDADIYRLSYFDRFLKSAKYSCNILTREIFDDYICTLNNKSKRTKSDYISAAMRFGKYLSMFYPDSYIPYIPQRTPKPKKAYIYSNDEIKTIMHEIRNSSKIPEIGLRYYTITGILVFTGIRIKECLNLNLEDWNPKEKTLYIRNGKFGKDRLIPVAESTAAKIESYIDFKYNNKIYKGVPLFSSRNSKRLGRSQYSRKLEEILQNNNITGSVKSRKPTIHGFRHTYAVNMILKWKKENRNINVMLPYLVTYMGHVNIESTEVYLQSVEEIMQLSAERYYTVFSRIL